MSRPRVFPSRAVGPAILVAATALATSGWRVGVPFRGLGHDADLAVVHAGAAEQVLVVVTRGKVRAGRGTDFVNLDQAVWDAMREEPGLASYSMPSALFDSRVWTMSVRIDRGSMGQFACSGAHRHAMAPGTLVKGSFPTATALVDPRLVPLDWTASHRLLEGRANQE